jgi:hypothetical protein
MDLAFTLPFPIGDVTGFWSSVANTIAEETNEIVEQLARQHYLAFLLWSFRTGLSVGKLRDWYGLDYLFGRQRSLIYPNVFHRSISEWIVLRVAGLDSIGPADPQETKRIYRAAEDVGLNLLRSKMPCFSYSPRFRSECDDLIEALERDIREIEPIDIAKESISGGAALGIFCLFAVMSESSGRQKQLYDILVSSHNPLLNAIGEAVRARENPVVTGDLMSRFGIMPDGVDFVQRWITRRFSFIA